MKIYMLEGCPFAHRATFALREKNVAFEPVFFEVGKRPPELAAVGPHAKSPTLFVGDARIWDSTIVLEYVEDAYPDPPLMPRDAEGRAAVRNMAARVEKELTALQAPLVMELIYKPEAQRDLTKVPGMKKAYLEGMAPWNELLRDREWLVGGALSLADITLYTPLVGGQRLVGVGVPAELTHLAAWIERMRQRPASTPVTS